MPSIRQRGDHFMVIYRDHTGKQRSAGSRKTKAEARKLLRSTTDGATRVTEVKTYSAKALGSYAPAWLSGKLLEGHTYRSYRGSINKWIIPYLGDKQVGKITKADIRTWIQQMIADGGNNAAIGKAHVVLSSLFNTAVEDGDAKENPCKGVKVPPVATRVRRILTHTEFQKLLAEIPEQYKPLIQTAIGTGARWGELVALNPSDVSGEFLAITKAVGGNKVLKSYPKNTEHRRIKITADLAEQMASYPDYSKLDYGNFRQRTWLPAVKAAGLEGFTFHGLRHTHASWLLANGCDLQTLKERLGHKDLNTTQKYLHTLPTSQDSAVQALERAMQ